MRTGLKAILALFEVKWITHDYDHWILAWPKNGEVLNSDPDGHNDDNKVVFPFAGAPNTKEDFDGEKMYTRKKHERQIADVHVMANATLWRTK